MGCKRTVMPTYTKKVWREIWTTEVLDTWKNKPLHGQYAKQVASVTDEEHAYKWMKTTELKIETEALITAAAQEQALNTKQHQAKVLHTTKNLTYRLCNQQMRLLQTYTSCVSQASSDRVSEEA
jgi:hypothetical protein